MYWDDRNGTYSDIYVYIFSSAKSPFWFTELYSLQSSHGMNKVYICTSYLPSCQNVVTS